MSQKNALSELLVNLLLSEQLVNPWSQGQGLTRGCLLMAILKVLFLGHPVEYFYLTRKKQLNVSYNTLKSSSTRLEPLAIHCFWTTPKISYLIQHSLFSCYQSPFRCHSYIFCPSLHAAEKEGCLKI